MASPDVKRELLQKKVWAVAGASTNPEKYGYRVYRCLKQHGYEVYPINPGAPEVDGDTAYANVQSLPKVPDVVNMVVPPKVGLDVARECADQGIKNIWMQPGAESKELIEYCQKAGLTALSNECVLRELGC